jgi:hypothetical protein
VSADREAGSYRPRTRWCGPHPFAAASAAPREVAQPAPLRAAPARLPARPHASSAGEVLLAQLQRDLQRGHWRLALRHFLMLQAYGCEVPPAEQRHCLEHARACAHREWLKMQADVAAWARCVARPQASAPRGPMVPDSSDRLVAVR